MKRRSFIHALIVSGFALLMPLTHASAQLYRRIGDLAKASIRAIVSIMEALKNERSNLVKKTLNGRKYIKKPEVFYPYDHSIEDINTSCQVFFHAHRPEDYGHFHTFINNEAGELVHLVMISMDKKGKPIALSTLNQWVTGDFFVDAKELKKLFVQFKMNHDLFPDKRIIEFIEYVFAGYQNSIFELFDERDKSVKKYVKQNAREPFEDRDIEILSIRNIDVYKDSV